MGRLTLICRLVLRDVRRHPVGAAVFLLAVAAATATLSVGLAMNGVTGRLYLQTRQATVGPDVVALSADASRADLSSLAGLEHMSGVAGHSGPYPVTYTTLKANGYTVSAVAEGREMAAAPIDRPLVTSGSWVRPGSVVVERGFADALGLHVGGHVAVAGRRFEVAGIAVTAASTVYPWAQMVGQGGGTSGDSGLVWFTERDVRALSAPQLFVLNLKLARPAAAQAFVDSFTGSTIPVDFFTWQFIPVQDSVLLRGTEPALVIGGWLLGFLALVSLAELVAVRTAEQIKRTGLLKAAGATPGLVAAVLLAEYLALALSAAGLGLLAGWLAVPSLADPSAGLIDTAAAPSHGVVESVVFLALAVMVLTALGPAVRAARTSTVSALAGAARPPRHRAGLPARLPASLQLGLRLIARRPLRTILHSAGVAATATAIGALVTLRAQPSQGYNAGASTLPDLRGQQDAQVLLGVTVALVILAAVNAIVITWSMAVQSRRSLAIARALGATPGQVTAGLCIAQLLPALCGAIAGIPIGIALYWVFSIGTMTIPPAPWLLAAVAATPLTMAAFAAVPAMIEAGRPVTGILSSETA